jgi:hypothetical protein
MQMRRDLQRSPPIRGEEPAPFFISRLRQELSAPVRIPNIRPRPRRAPLLAALAAEDEEETDK